MGQVVHVAVAVIRHPAHPGQVLIAQRPDHLHQGGLWEFPGGKVEAAESLEQALTRELNEELGIDASLSAKVPLMKIRHDYPDKSVLLDVWVVTGFQGQAYGAEGQTVCWEAVESLSRLPFPEANKRIIAALNLPAVYAIYSPPPSEPSSECRVLKPINSVTWLRYRPDQNLERNVALPSFGEHWVVPWKMIDTVSQVADVQMRCVGLHLTAKELCETSLDEVEAYQQQNLRVLGSCHNATEIALANQLQLDAITLSPVLSTATHPDLSPLGWAQFRALVSEAMMPVYALGGQSIHTLETAKSHGALGVAGISAFFDPVASNNS